MSDLASKFSKSLENIKLCNPLSSAAVKFADKHRPITSATMKLFECNIRDLRPLGYGYYYYNYECITIVGRLRRNYVFDAYVINNSEINLSAMADTVEQSAYGLNRNNPISNIVGYIVNIMLCSECDSTLVESLKNYERYSRVSRVLSDYGQYHLVGAHVEENGIPYSCMVVMTRRDGNYLDMICLADCIVDKVLEINSSVRKELMSGGGKI